MVRRLLASLVLGLAAGTTLAQTVPPAQSNPPPQEDRPFFSRISGLFGGDLPQLDRPDTVKLILRPHFGDFVRRDYLRVDTGLDWSLNDHFELSTEALFYFTHGFGSTADGYGIGELQFGAKYVFEEWPEPGYETTFALDVALPVGHAPIDMTDGYYHVNPTVVVQHLWISRPRLTTFGGLGVDLISKSRIAGRFSTNQPHDDSFSVTSGGVYDAGQLKWTLSGTIATTALISHTARQFFYLQPGLLWYVPKRFTLHSKTQWIVGLSARTTFGPDGVDFSLSSRLRAEITFRQVMDKLRGRSSDKPSP
jgi:hypothetical protein